MISKTCECKNCVHVRKQQAAAINAVSEAATRRKAVDQAVVDAWNITISEFPCLNISPKYYYHDAVATLGDVLNGFEVLSGDVVGDSGKCWQDHAFCTAKDLRRLANMLDAACKGDVLCGPVVFPSPREIMNPEA